MGEYGLGLNVRALSPVDFNQLSNHPSLFSPENLHHRQVEHLEQGTMQDETLATLKTSNKPKQLSPQSQQLSSADRLNTDSSRQEDFMTQVSKSADVSNSHYDTVSSLDRNSLDDQSIHSSGASPVSLGMSTHLDSTSALGTAQVPNLWSWPTADDTPYMQGLPAMSSMNGGVNNLNGGINSGLNSGLNGHGAINSGSSLPFPNFPPQVHNQIYNNQSLSQQFSSSLQISGNHQQSPAQRRAITGQHPITQAIQQQQQQQQQRMSVNQSNPFFNNSKTYPTWSSASQQQSWSNAQQPQNPWSNVQRRPTSVPNHAGPIGAQMQFQKKMMSSSIISPSRFRRSTSYPGQVQQTTSYAGKSLFDITPPDDHRELPYNVFGNYHHQQQQERLSLDTMRFPMLESHLMDIMRGTNQATDHHDQIKINQRFPYMLTGKSPFGNLGDSDGHFLDDGSLDQTVPNINSPNRGSPGGLEHIERFSRKVFVGGLPPDIDEEEITAAFRRFGALVVDWPHKAESKSYFPPKGYCFLLFQDEMSVQNLIASCIVDDEKLYWCVSSPTMKDKPVQIRPWNLSDSDFVMDGSQPLDPRKTIFVGGVPRPLRAIELAMIMDRLYGGVCYAGIDTDPELKYPKGAGRVAFSNQQSYIAAISARFVQLQHGDIDKRVEVKPYVLDDQMCDECSGARCAGKFAPFFCANVMCLQYYCEQCWAQVHSRQGREFHKPLVKEGADRPRAVPFRWC